jgi:hypothetical protein
MRSAAQEGEIGDAVQLDVGHNAAVIPAKAGIQCWKKLLMTLDSGSRTLSRPGPE